MIKLYDFLPSGNGYKVRLCLTQLGREFERVEINILNGESRTVEFLDKNPNGRIPVIEVEPGKYLFESNAILVYLSQGTQLYPQSSWEQAQVLQWMFFEQYSHEPYIATPRYWISILGKEEEYEEAIQQKRQGGYGALEVMERYLSVHDFFVGEGYSVADIALFAYTHVAPEGGYDLSGFPAIQNWIGRIEAQPGFIPLMFDRF
ncbi:glutathione S-transferase family protein [Roseofilum capinflatum]|uniref:Glutathione S-transferase family protein n=1 Tax=Roseofilum capinflatum BLCC-M114 TaxID=3022440 RepID=A0ABT7B3Y6_9CYAN|nr:glutathione S-transferase family protein [Roseofilum capinflatum]MDJ1173897.1 glutathione S-transferase family protein [Roseofilum capinflatum BLCC-M114]